MKKCIIVGEGEVGSAIKQIELESGNSVEILDLDKKPKNTDGVDCMHICIPYGIRFLQFVTKYVNDYKPKLLIIHATIKPGTTQRLQKMLNIPVVHSLVRGVHPNLYEGLKTFVKYVGGEEQAVIEATEYLEKLGFKVRPIGTSINTELGKILSTSYYGWNILFAKQVKKLCKMYGADFEKVYTDMNNSYNEGYEKLGKKNVIRPVLFPPDGKILGHCISQNIELLPDTKLKKMFKELNDND